MAIQALRAGLVAAAFFSGVFLIAGPAAAVPVTVNMSGHLTSVPGTLSTAFTPNEAFSLSYSYDTTAPDQASNTTLGLYYYQSYDLTIGSGPGQFALHAPAGAVFANSIQIVNLSSFDAYKVDATDNLTFTNAALFDANYTLVQALFQFTYLASQFPNDSLLAGAPPFTSGNALNLEFRPDPGSLDGRVFVQGVITSASAVTISAPAPATLLLLVPGLIALAGLRRKP
jgi:hypothetical protein